MDMKINGNSLMQQNTDQIVNRQADQSFAEKLQKAYDENDKEQLKEACQQFEGIFLQLLYKQMKATVPKSDLIPESAGTDVFEGMLDEELMGQAQKRGIGLSEMLYGQMAQRMDNTYVSTGEGVSGDVDQNK